jgi:hypothetical protein
VLAMLKRCKAAFIEFGVWHPQQYESIGRV